MLRTTDQLIGNRHFYAKKLFEIGLKITHPVSGAKSTEVWWWTDCAKISAKSFFRPWLQNISTYKLGWWGKKYLTTSSVGLLHSMLSTNDEPGYVWNLSDKLRSTARNEICRPYHRRSYAVLSFPENLNILSPVNVLTLFNCDSTALLVSV